MDQVFTHQLNFDKLLDELDFRGGAFEPQGVQPSFLIDLKAEISHLNTSSRISDGKVQERYERARMIGRERFSPLVGVLANHLAWGVRLSMGRRAQLRSWMPNDVEVHHYRDSKIGISPHRDFCDNELLIVSVTVDGFAPFEFHGATRSNTPTIWETGPGSVVILAASNYGGRLATRPYHAIGAPYNGSRTSIIFWMSQRILHLDD